MFKRNQFYTVIAATSMLAAVSTNTLAQSPVVSEATVNVQNTFTFNVVDAINFGTLRATAEISGAGTTTYLVSGDGTTTVGTAGGTSSLTELTAGTPGTYEISGAAPFTDISITVPAAETVLTLSASPPGTPNFAVDSWTAYITSGSNANQTYASGSVEAQTDATGAVTFSLGATLETDDGTSTAPYIDGDYTGNYTVSVSY